jgi:hypothetical protein
MDFTPLERDVLNWIASHVDDPALAEQLKSAQPVSREFTGVGSFTVLKVPPGLPGVGYRVAPIDPHIESPEIQEGAGGAGVVLFCDGGQASLLEFYTFGSTVFPESLTAWTLS